MDDGLWRVVNRAIISIAKIEKFVSGHGGNVPGDRSIGGNCLPNFGFDPDQIAYGH
jgi:hypothetical protein